jgi:hypothetical protein
MPSATLAGRRRTGHRRPPLWYRAAELADDEEPYKGYLEAAARCDREVEAAIDELLADIARRELHVPMLEVRRSDRLDFHEIGVTSLHRALWAAYRAGRDAAK